MCIDYLQSLGHQKIVVYKFPKFFWKNSENSPIFSENEAKYLPILLFGLLLLFSGPVGPVWFHSSSKEYATDVDNYANFVMILQICQQNWILLFSFNLGYKARRRLIVDAAERRVQDLRDTSARARRPNRSNRHRGRLKDRPRPGLPNGHSK